jgi:hypothetical protein
MPDNKTNEEKFLEMLKVADPELYALKIALLETKLPPDVAFQIIRHVGNFLLDFEFGKVEINIANKHIQSVVSQAHTKIFIVDKA